MSLEERVRDLEFKLDNLQSSFLQSQKNQIPLTGKTDDSYNKIPQINENTEGIEQNADDILVTQEGVAEAYELTTEELTQFEEAIAEVYEMIAGM